MQIKINVRRTEGWEEAPPHYLTGYNFAGAMLELQGRDVIAKASNGGITALICGTPQLIAATKAKHPDGIIIERVGEWETARKHGKFILSFATFSAIIDRHYPHLAAEYFPEAWQVVINALAETFKGCKIEEIRGIK